MSTSFLEIVSFLVNVFFISFICEYKSLSWSDKKNWKNKARTRLDDGNAVPKYCGGELKPNNWEIYDFKTMIFVTNSCDVRLWQRLF